MRGYAKAASVGLLMTGLLAMPNLSTAKDGNGRHSLLNTDLRSKIEHIRDKIEDRREHRHHNNNEGGVPGSITALQAEVANLKSALATANGQLSVLDGRLKALEASGGGGGANQGLAELAKYVKVELGALNGVKGPHVVFTGVNLHVRSGRNATNDNLALSGLGNLIVGYNEAQSNPVVYDVAGCDRTLTGSHNIVTGDGNMFTSYGGLVVGSNHCVTSPNTSILAGNTNEAHGPNSAILGGTRMGTFGLNETVPRIR